MTTEETDGSKTPSPDPPDPEQPAAGIRYASDEMFEQAHQKTSRLHAGLFRRLAQ